jgi:hypothetical protein
MKWLQTQPGYENATEQLLLDKQENANGKGRYEVLDLIQRYIKEHGGTRNTMNLHYQILRSFFLHNRRDLPRDKFDVGPGTRASVQGTLTVEGVKRIIESAGLRDRAIFLTIWQGLMDKERFIQFNESNAESLVGHLREKGIDVPFRIDFRFGRKRNYQPYYTFLGKDCLQSWKEYFEKERGYPKAKGEAIALTRDLSHPVNKPVLVGVFRTLRRRTGLKKRDQHGFIGITIHEFRDVARSTLQLAKKDGFDETCAEFWMGHKIDPLGYNKFTSLSPDYVLKNYKIAEKYLNILSGNVSAPRLEIGEFEKMFVTVMENWEKAGAFENPAALRELVRLAKQEPLR